MAGVPYVFGNATTSIPLTNLDANFNTGLTIGNTTVGLGNTVTTLGNVTLTNATVSSASITDSGLTSGRAVYTGTGGLLSANANLTYDGTTFTAVNDASISGLTVGKGTGSLALNTAVGAGALGSVNTGDGQCSAFGFQVLNANTSGAYNTGVGLQALLSNTTGSLNISVGGASLRSNTTGASNTAIGFQSLNANTTASNNTAVGYQALYTNTTSANITAVGNGSLYRATGIENTAIGNNSGNSTTTGYSNIYVGNQSGNWNVNHTTGYESVFIGNKSSPAAGADNNTIVIGAGTTNGKGSNTGIINAGGGGVYQGNNSATWSITSDARLKKNIVDNTTGLSAITAIQVRNFEYRTKDEITELEPQNAIDIKGVQLGAIAQELQAILPDCVKTESTGVMSVNSENLTWYLINAVKELNAKITVLENK